MQWPLKYNEKGKIVNDCNIQLNNNNNNIDWKKKINEGPFVCET
jgi:hypothetical protein